MLFNSFEFIFTLLPCSAIGYFLAGRISTRLAIWWLVAVSFFFYAWWRPANLPLFLGSILFNFCAAWLLNLPGDRVHRRVILLGSIVCNLGLLAIYKYGDFIVENLNGLIGMRISPPHLILPLGISFFTFTQITYLADIFKARRSKHSLSLYALFVSFYPHLLAGPILHHQEMLPQFEDENNRRLRFDNIWRGLCLFGVGLSKKVLLADALAPFARFGFDSAPSLNFLEVWLTALAYCFQIYFDFSGYTDMAIGVAVLMNIRLPFNFDSPYRSLDIQSFWRRWHITLGRFFRDYVYIPLGGNRLSRNRTLLNLFAVALLSGLWHGAAWSFVAWGGLHGAAMVIHSLWKRFKCKMAWPLAWLLMFVFINVSWVLFRAKDWSRACAMLRAMIGRNGIVLFAQLEPLLKPLKRVGVEFKPLSILEVEKLLLYLCIAFGVALWPRNSNALLDGRRRIHGWLLCVIAVLTAVSILNLNQLSEFIYFNF